MRSPSLPAPSKGGPGTAAPEGAQRGARGSLLPQASPQGRGGTSARAPPAQELPAPARVERLCPELRARGEGPPARMIGKDFLAKLLSRWIYPGLVLVDSGTFSLLSRFLFMTCHLLQQARRESSWRRAPAPTAIRERGGIATGSRELLFRNVAGAWQQTPGCPLPCLAQPGLGGWEGAAPARAGGAGSCRLVGEDPVPAMQQRFLWQALNRYRDHLECARLRGASCSPVRGLLCWGPPRFPTSSHTQAVQGPGAGASLVDGQLAPHGWDGLWVPWAR